MIKRNISEKEKLNLEAVKHLKKKDEKDLTQDDINQLVIYLAKKNKIL